MLGLIASNMLTLVNADIHTASFNALKAILSPVVTDATLSRILSHSPTQKHSELKRLSIMRTNTAKRISTRIARSAIRAIANAFRNVSISDIADDCQTLQDVNELNVAFEHEKEDETTVCGMDLLFLKAE